MKKKKLDLKALEVKSFITSMENGLKDTIQGGKHTDQLNCTGAAVCVQDSEDCDSNHPWYCDNIFVPIRTIKPIRPIRF
ncbi:MAG: pinensin family lanthipeptide [Bacteroidota bacterium]